MLAIFLCLFAGFQLMKVDKAAGQTTTLSAPTGLTASDNTYNLKIGLHWDPVRGAIAYRVFRSSTPDLSGAAEVGLTPANTFFDLGAPAGQQLFYWVRAENGGVVSQFSNSDGGARTGTAQQGPVPPLEPPPIPPGNPVTAAKTFLGKTLFWDEQLSSTGTVACGTCHHAANGGTDPRSVALATASLHAGPDGSLNTADDIRGSAGVPLNNADGSYVQSAFGLNDQVTTRKSVSHINSGYPNLLFWDGRANNVFRDPITNVVILNNGGALENQAMGPPVSDVEMAHSGRSLIDMSSKVALAKPLALSASVPTSMQNWLAGRSYPELFQEAFGTPEVSPARIAMALATYQRTQFSDQAPIDLANAGIAALTPEEQRGRNVFNASACNVCHAGNLFTDNSFRYIGVRPQNDDLGRFDVTGNNNDRGSFRVPSLRNVELRQSFFHNGRFTSLNEVVAFYNRGGDFNAPNKPIGLIRPLGLNANQQADLIAFLRRPLTDPRVASESERFDRPVLYTESERKPTISGTGRVGSGSVTPQIKAISPPVVGNQQFTVSLTGALGNAAATLVIDSSDPGIGVSIPASGSLARVVTNTQNTGPGNGWASAVVAIPNSSTVAGRTFFGRWYVQDAGAPGGFSVSPVMQFTVFGSPTESSFITISGSVFTPDGFGLRNATVVLTDPSGSQRRAVTSSFGIFSFDNVQANLTYTLSVSSRRYRFTPAIVTPTANLTNVNFVGLQ
jgi:cytochrome c peroxidase